MIAALNHIDTILFSILLVLVLIEVATRPKARDDTDADEIVRK